MMKIFANWQAAGYVPPVFKNNEPTHWFTVELHEKTLPALATTQKTTQKQRAIITYLQNHPGATIKGNWCERGGRDRQWREIESPSPETKGFA